MLTFIPSHAVHVPSAIPKIFFSKIINSWDIYEPENNNNMMENLWEYLKQYIPEKYNKETLDGYNIEKISLMKIYPKSTNRRRKEKEKRSEGKRSLLTVFIFCNDVNDGAVRFFDKKRENIVFSSPGARYYQVKNICGDIVIFTNKIEYIESISEEIKYILKIPIYYNTDKKEKRVRFNF